MLSKFLHACSPGVLVPASLVSCSLSPEFGLCTAPTPSLWTWHSALKPGCRLESARFGDRNCHPMAIDGVIQTGKLLADLIDHREVESRYVYTSQHCRSHIFRAGVRGKAFLRAGGKTRPRWHRPDAVGIHRRAVLDRWGEFR